MKRSGGWLIAGLVALVVFTVRKFGNVLDVQRIRVDPSGDGHFGAEREGHIHHGVDLLVTPGEVVRSPITGIYVRPDRPYIDDPTYRGVVIQGEGVEVKIFYCLPLPSLKIGQPVQRGQALAWAQAISDKYGPPMKDHIHVEVYRIQDGELLDPESMLRLA